jgi:uncharacterized FAD-dependent dehydrogenase
LTTTKRWGKTCEGYAGGILSAAVDGIEVAEALALDMVKN